MATQTSADTTEQRAPGERRQLTFVYCDLVGSTQLSQRLDPEVVSRLIRDYYKSCHRIIKQLDGYPARLAGDGILAYFCYPEAREDAAERAIRASLRIVDWLAAERFEGDVRLDVHIGVATGVAVISDIVGPGFAERHTATGVSPNLGARIQALATAGTVLVSEETRKLAGGFFTYADTGLHHFRGFEHPERVWRVTGESQSRLRFEAQHAQLFDFVGREPELATLGRLWEQAQRGVGNVVTVRGEAGIGKSRLLRVALERFGRASGLVAELQCSPQQAAAPLHPVIDWIRSQVRVIGREPADDLDRLGAWLGTDPGGLEVALVAELAGVAAPAHAQALRAIPVDRKRALVHEILVRHFQRHCGSSPILFMLEDAHWMDRATGDFLRALFRAMRQQRFLALVSERTPEWDWRDACEVTDIELKPLPAADALALIRNASRGKALPAQQVELIQARSDGVPLFLEELTATLLESGDQDLPSTLRDSLAARLDRLEGAREVARIASAIGREFSFALLQRVSGYQPRALLTALKRLVAAQLLYRRSVGRKTEYVFKHALVQQAAYDGLLRSDRRALHARIVDVIETHQPELAAREPGLMAHHCREAELREREVDYRYVAGLGSTRLVAVPEALSHFTRAREVVAALPATPRNVKRHIDVLLGLMEVGRFAILPQRLIELGATARSLAATEGVRCDADTMASILFQEGRALLYSSRYAEARRLFDELRELGRAQGSERIGMRPGSALTMALCCQGLFAESLAFMNEANVGRWKEAGSVIDYIAGLGWTAYALCETGPGDDGLRFADLSVREAEQLQSPIYVAGARIWRSHALMAARRFDEAVADAQRCVDVSEEQAVPYLGWHGLVFLALCQCRAGAFDAALDALARARVLLAGTAGGQWSLLDYLPAIEAEIACRRGAHDRALACADEAIAAAQPVEGCFAEAMAWRVKAESSLATGVDVDAAQEMFERAVRLHERGGARAERAFSTLVWAHALQGAGHAGRARRMAAEASEQARAGGFDLRRCEYGAAVAP